MDYDLTPGESVDVIVGERRCAASVREITGDGLFTITAPAFRSAPLTLGEGELVNVIFFRRSGVFSFVALLLGCFREGQAELCRIEMKSPISKYQRRDFARLELSVPVKTALVAGAGELAEMPVGEVLRSVFDRTYMGMPREGDYDRRECSCLDISGGGLRFASGEYYELDSLLECTFTLPGTGEITADCLVARVEETSVGVMFVNLEERLRRKIVRFIFNSQAKQAARRV